MKTKITLPLYTVTESNDTYIEVHQSLMDKVGFHFTDVSERSYWEKSTDTYYLCHSDQTTLRSKLGSTQLSTNSTDVPFIPWEWEPFEF